MQFRDFSPPSDPSLPEQQDVLRKGLGRAFLWASAGKLSPDILLDASLHDPRFDKQCERIRALWLWDLINLTGNSHLFREPILTALQQAQQHIDSYQLCEFALLYARQGDSPFLAALYDLVQRRDDLESVLGERELIQLDGLTAFNEIARLRGIRLNSRDWGWDDESILDFATEWLGTQPVHDALDHHSDPDIRRFAQAVPEKTPRVPMTAETHQEPRQKKLRSITAEEVISSVRGEIPFVNIGGWGRYASQHQLQKILRHLTVEQDIQVLEKLLRVFWDNPLPYFEPRLLELCTDPHSDLRRHAFNALKHTSHPHIRDFALQELRRENPDRQVASLFINNFQPGDEQLLLQGFEFPPDLDQKHWLLMDLRKVLALNPDSDPSQLGLICYFENPCEICREDATRVLQSRHLAPDWLRAESRFDSHADTRSLFAL